ncbi:hypothetical protein Aph02nite_18290 [Actinoplanes philippinensis]|uniref:Uncharacterized protein n=1 Tax=Actinoplanes philippinensis TaxID=35752 RepID=A0A1I2BFR0_9ACTN|nr:hypothetical protein [Actinoplanes philippinensis]GIE75879.1 hypothetical protein Aph02nite_18290 [Actinoplanes philippinensis]SFE54797.1 hypothetical protein SAMN05421541_102294 [Actinoplanes philippinensis]
MNEKKNARGLMRRLRVAVVVAVAAGFVAGAVSTAAPAQANGGTGCCIGLPN